MTDNMDKAGTLLPCPFCGHDPVWRPVRLSGRVTPSVVTCINDDCFGPQTTATGDDGIIQWNTRAALPHLGAQCAAVIEECAVALQKFYPDHAAINAYCAAIRSLQKEPVSHPTVQGQPWDAHANRTYAPVEARAAEIYAAFEYEGPGPKPAWVPNGNSIRQDDARHLARQELRATLPPSPPAEGE